jgi:hypothetical protein
MLDLDQDPDPNIVNSDPQSFWEKAHQPEFSVQMSSSLQMFTAHIQYSANYQCQARIRC